MPNEKPTEYISREAAISAIREAAIPCNEIFYAGVVSAFKSVNSVPAADVVPVVRCKDCKYRYTTACLMEFTVNGKSIEWSANNRSCNIGTPQDGGEHHAD